MKTKVLIVLLLAAAVCVTAVWSQGGNRPAPPGPPGPGGPGPRGPMMPSVAMAVLPPPPDMFLHQAEALGLTDDQLAQLQENARTFQETVRPLMQKVGESCKALRDAVLAPDYDAARVAALAAAASKAEAALVTAGIDQWTRIRSVLTSDQIAKLQEVMNAHRPGPPGPPPPPPPPGQ